MWGSTEQVLGWGWSGEGSVLLGTFEILATLPGAGAEHHPSVAILLPASSVAIETGTLDKQKAKRAERILLKAMASELRTFRF